LGFTRWHPIRSSPSMSPTFSYPYTHANVCCCDWKSSLSISQNIVKGFDNTNQCTHERSSCVVENLKARSERDVRLNKEGHGRETLTMISSLLSKVPWWYITTHDKRNNV
jgi:hypothetical protein